MRSEPGSLRTTDAELIPIEQAQAITATWCHRQRGKVLPRPDDSSRCRPAGGSSPEWSGWRWDQRIAIGLTGEPVAAGSRSGAITQRKDHRLSSSHTGTRSSNCR
jgi:hypothetical protein